jgi:hypothetical protein
MDDVRPKVLLEKHWRGRNNFWSTGFITALQTCIRKNQETALSKEVIKEAAVGKKSLSRFKGIVYYEN